MQHTTSARRGALTALLIATLSLQATVARAASSATITVNTTADAVAADANCSLREAIASAESNTAANGCAAGAGDDTIVFALPDNSTITLGSELALSAGGLTIDAGNAKNLTLTRTGAGRLMTINTALGARVTLKGFTMSGGNVTAGAPNTDATRGGAVFTNLTQLELIGMTFRGNSAASDGGAVYAGATVNASKSRFENNSAGVEGGAIFAGRNSFGPNYISDSTFTNNTAALKGGALFVKGSSNSAEPRSTFITRSMFTNNRVTATVSARGGAISVNSPLHVSHSHFERNDSNTFCGGVNLQNTDNPGNPLAVPTFITSTRFISNSGQLGGGLCVDGPVTVVDSLFERNFSNDEGGGMVGNNLVTIRGSTFYSNTSRSSGAGVAVRFKADISHSRFIENYSQVGLGGGVFITSTAQNSLVANSLFVRNQGAGGSAIGVRTYTNTLGYGVLVNHVTMVDNLRFGSGAVEVTQYGEITVTNSIIGGSDLSFQRRPEYSPPTQTAQIIENYNLLFDSMDEFADGRDKHRHQALPIGPQTVEMPPDQRPTWAGPNDFHLTPGHPAIGIADATITAALGDAIDFDNEARPTGAPSRSDAGFDEFGTLNPPVGLNVSSSGAPRVGEPAPFNASVTGGSNVTYEWNYGDGTIVLSSGGTPNTSHVYEAQGAYTVIVTATNSFGSASASTVVNVTNTPNTAPTANAGADIGALNSAQVQLNGSASTDADGDLPLTYQWTQTAGTLVTLSSATAVSPTFTAPASAGSLTFSLVVVDARGLASAADTVVVTVSNNPINGLTAINDGPTKLGSPTRFTATIASSAAPVTYQWHFGVSGATATGAHPSYTYPAVGAYTATVTATNGSDTKVTTTQVTVSNNPITGLSFPAPAPSVVISVPTVFTASVTGGGPVEFTWMLSGPQSANATGPSFTMTVTRTGTYQLTVTARNTATNETRTFARTIVVSDRVVAQPGYKILLPITTQSVNAQ